MTIRPTQITNEAYHASPGISKSGIWTIWTKTPAHYKYGEKPISPAFGLGSAAHAAILEPDVLEAKFYRGPDDRRGNKWSDAQEHCEANALELLTSTEYDTALRVRDSAARIPIVRALADQAVIEHAGFWTDSDTGTACRCKPDIYSPSLYVIADIKTAISGSPQAFAKAVDNYGYHVQDSMYSDGWQKAGGGEVLGFVFIAIEKTAPYLVSVFELDDEAKREGYAIYRAALTRYAECEQSGVWPGYAPDVQRVGLPKWAQRVVGEEE